MSYLENAKVGAGSKVVVSIVAYMLGVDKEAFYTNFDLEAYEELETIKAAKTVRSLNRIKNGLLHHFFEIRSELWHNITNLDKMPSRIDQEALQYLASVKVEVVKPNTRAWEYFGRLNRLLAEPLKACQPLFPEWLRWDYIKKQFLLPAVKDDKAGQALAREYERQAYAYPYGTYLNWQKHRKKNGHSPRASEDILQDDKRYLELLYWNFNDTFSRLDLFVTVQETQKEAQDMDKVMDFVRRHHRIALIVDCENSNPCLLLAALNTLKRRFAETNSADYAEECVSKIQKVILMDCETNTEAAWKEIGDILDFPVERINIERMCDKSVVDVRLATETCKQHYVHGIDGFILAASDSDYYGLMSALSTAGFIVLATKESMGRDMRKRLNKDEIPVVYMNKLSAATIEAQREIVTKSLKRQLAKYALTIPLREEVITACKENFVFLSKDEKDNLALAVLKDLVFEVDDRGHAALKVS